MADLNLGYNYDDDLAGAPAAQASDFSQFKYDPSKPQAAGPARVVCGNVLQNQVETLGALPQQADRDSYKAQFQFDMQLAVQAPQPEIFSTGFQMPAQQDFQAPSDLDALLSGSLANVTNQDVACLPQNLDFASLSNQKAQQSNLKSQFDYTRLDRIPGAVMAFNVVHQQTGNKFVMQCYNLATTAPDEVERVQQLGLKKASSVDVFMEDGWMYALLQPANK